MNVILTALADYASVSNDNKLNILGIYQDINAQQFPVTIPHIYAVLTCEAEPAEYGKSLSTRVGLLDDDDAKEVLTLEGLMEVAQPKHPADRVFVNQIAGLSFVQFKHPGNYRFLFTVEGEAIASVPMRLNELE